LQLHEAKVQNGLLLVRSDVKRTHLPTDEYFVYIGCSLQHVENAVN